MQASAACRLRCARAPADACRPGAAPPWLDPRAQWTGPALAAAAAARRLQQPSREAATAACPPRSHLTRPCPALRRQEYRAAIIRNFCTKVDARSGKALPRHPVEPLSLAEVGETLHKPFDVAQTRFSLAGVRQ